MKPLPLPAAMLSFALAFVLAPLTSCTPGPQEDSKESAVKGATVETSARSSESSTTASSTSDTSEKPPAGATENKKAIPVLEHVSWSPIRMDGNLETWKDGVPKGWFVNEKFRDHVKSVKKSGSGSTAIQFEPNGEDYVMAVRRISRNLSGQTVRVKARGKASEPNSLYVALVYRCAGNEGFHSRSHSGNGQWETMEFEAQLPPDIEPNTLMIRVGVRPTSTSKAQADDIGLSIKQARKAHMIDVGGTFDEWVGNVPRGWYVNPLLELQVRRAEGSLDGSTCLKLTPLPDRYVESIRRIYRDDLVGRHVAVTASVKTEEADALYVALTYLMDGKEQVITRNHSGSSQWETIRLDTTISKEADAESVRLKVGVRPGKSTSALVDNVRIGVF